jgi:transcriptional regulator with XRE-family HTH domain
LENEEEMAFKKNEFGKLVKAYRLQRGWTQEELAERWGYSRGYLAQIEQGQRKLDSTEQVVRLADILNIPQEKLEAIGKGIPQRQIKVVTSREADDAILQMLLTPGRDMVKLAYMVWLGDQDKGIEENLREWTLKLEATLSSYSGEFVKPAQQLLAYAHLMRGRMSFDWLDFAAASGHFAEVAELGQELNDADIITLGMSYGADVLRKRGRYETALRLFEVTKPYVTAASHDAQGKHYTQVARAHYLRGDEEGFLRAINPALEIASGMTDSAMNLFSLDEVLCEQAAGYSRLSKPEKAMEIFKETDQLRRFRPMREQGSYTLEKALAHLYAADLDEGIALALKGLELASEYRSRRHVKRMDATYNRLKLLPFGGDKRLNTLRDAVSDALAKQARW